MFGVMDLRINHDSENTKSLELFNSIDYGDAQAYEEIFPAQDFRVISIHAGGGLEVSEFGQFAWEADDLYCECKAAWEIFVNPEDFESWGKEFQALWDNTSVDLEHAAHPGLLFKGYFSSTPEYS